MDLPYLYDVLIVFIILNVALHFFVFVFDKVMPMLKVLWNFLGWAVSSLWFVFYYNANFNIYWDIKIQMYVVIAGIVFFSHWLLDSDLLEGYRFVEYKFRNFLIVSLVHTGLLIGWYYVLWL